MKVNLPKCSLVISKSSKVFEVKISFSSSSLFNLKDDLDIFGSSFKIFLSLLYF